MIFSHLKGAKKFKVRINSSRNCSVCVRITFDEIESFARFNHVCIQFRRRIALAKCFAESARNFRFPWQLPSLNTTFFPNRQPKSRAFKSVYVVRDVFQLLYCCCGGERKKTYLKCRPLFARKFWAYPNVATSKVRIWLVICEFLWLLTNQNVWFVTSLHWINPLLHWITWKLHLS